MAISRRFGVTALKRNCRKQKLVAIATSTDEIVHVQPQRKPNGENRVKIRPARVEIIGLEEVVKKTCTETKHLAPR